MIKIKILVLLLCLSLSVQAQSNLENIGKTAIVKGKVMDVNNNPLEGATVSIKDNSGGTKTNANGEYNLIVPAERNIQIVSRTKAKKLKNLLT